MADVPDTPDQYPWADSWSWSPGREPEPEDSDDRYDDIAVPCQQVDDARLVLSAVLTDGRMASWSVAGGWSGDPDMVAAAQAVARLWPELPEHVRAARGLFGASVDGTASQSTWIAAQL